MPNHVYSLSCSVVDCCVVSRGTEFASPGVAVERAYEQTDWFHDEHRGKSVVSCGQLMSLPLTLESSSDEPPTMPADCAEFGQDYFDREKADSGISAAAEGSVPFSQKSRSYTSGLGGSADRTAGADVLIYKHVSV